MAEYFLCADFPDSPELGRHSPFCWKDGCPIPAKYRQVMSMYIDLDLPANVMVPEIIQLYGTVEDSAIPPVLYNRATKKSTVVTKAWIRKFVERAGRALLADAKKRGADLRRCIPKPKRKK